MRLVIFQDAEQLRHCFFIKGLLQVFEVRIIDEVSLVYHVEDTLQALFATLCLVRFGSAALISKAVESSL